MKLSIIISGFGAGGSERVLANLLKSQFFLSAFDSIVIYTVYPIDCYGVTKSKYPDHVQFYCFEKSKNIFAMKDILIRLRKSSPDIVLSFTHRLSQFLVACSRCGLLKTQLYVRVPTILSRRASSIWGYMDRLLFSTHKVKYICQSLYMVEDLSNYLYLKPKTDQVYNPIVLSSSADLTLNMTKPPYKFIYVGRMHYVKGFDRLINILDGLEKLDYSLSILSTDQIDLKYQEMYPQVMRRIKHLGFVQNPLEILSQHDALLLPSRVEGFPNVMLEAWAVGVPVVAFDCPGGIREVFSADRGLLIEDGDLVEFQRALMQFGDHVFSRKKMIDFVEENFSLSNIGQEYVRILMRNG